MTTIPDLRPDQVVEDAIYLTGAEKDGDEAAIFVTAGEVRAARAALSASLPEPQLGVERADVLATVLRCSTLSTTRAGLLTDALMPMLSAHTVTSKEGV